MDDIKKMAGRQPATTSEAGVPEDTGINTLMAGPGDFMNQIGSSQLVTERTAESFGVLDVAGMNYLDARYELDKKLFPNRVIVGTETFPTRIANNWALVEAHPHAIGDFTWTGWDYLGEVGLGRAQYLAKGEAPSLLASYPWTAAWCGDIDMTGNGRTISFYREIVFGLRSTPYIAVHRPRPEATSFSGGPWTWSDSISSWSWSGSEGTDPTVDVYSDADEVELFLDGQSVGKGPHRPRPRFHCAVRDCLPADQSRAHPRRSRTLRPRLHSSHLGAHHLGLTDSGEQRRRNLNPLHQPRSRPGPRINGHWRPHRNSQLGLCLHHRRSALPHQFSRSYNPGDNSGQSAGRHPVTGSSGWLVPSHQLKSATAKAIMAKRSSRTSCST
jgi:hypothetical protein